MELPFAIFTPVPPDGMAGGGAFFPLVAIAPPLSVLVAEV
jgi:hypothetical protein